MPWLERYFTSADSGPSVADADRAVFPDEPFVAVVVVDLDALSDDPLSQLARITPSARSNAPIAAARRER